MSIVTLTTDLGYRDPYLAIVKAKLITGNSTLQIVDLSCEIKSNTISDAAFILKNALPHFPPQSIHLVAVKFVVNRSNASRNETIDNSRFLLTRYRDQYIICPDNGLLTLIEPEFDAPVYQLYYDGQTKHHFFLKDVFVDAALHIAAGHSITDIATATDHYYRAAQFEPFISGNVFRGKGIYVDSFGNIITNITQLKFNEVVGKKNFTVTLPGVRINRISASYDDVKYGNPLLLFNSFGYLEVAVNGKNAYEMLCPREIGSTFDFNILIEFYD